MVGRVLGVVVPVLFLDDVAIACDHKTANRSVGVFDELHHLIEDGGTHALLFWRCRSPSIIGEVGDRVGCEGVTLGIGGTELREKKEKRE